MLSQDKQPCSLNCLFWCLPKRWKADWDSTSGRHWTKCVSGLSQKWEMPGEAGSGNRALFGSKMSYSWRLPWLAWHGQCDSGLSPQTLVAASVLNSAFFFLVVSGLLKDQQQIFYKNWQLAWHTQCSLKLLALEKRKSHLLRWLALVVR